MSEKLKPCPFCGGEARLSRDFQTFHFVRCEDCGLGTQFRQWRGKAIRAWNRRTPKEKPDA